MAENYYDQVQPPYTVETAFIACGFPQARAEKVASEFFNDNFLSCKNTTRNDMKDAFKALAGMTIAQGGMKFTPMQKNYIQTFCYWVKHQYRMNRELTAIRFPFTRITEIKLKANIHAQYIERHETIASAAKPKEFTKDMKWDDWYPSFLNYLRIIPGREGIPLQYVIRTRDMPTFEPMNNYLDEYIDRAALTGDAFNGDAAQVHVYIVSFIAGNDEAESAIKVLENERNGRKDWIALKEHYQGIGVFTTDVVQAEEDIALLYYQGEKRPTMYWLLFEQRLNKAYDVMTKRENRMVYSNEMKLRTLLRKIRCDWLDRIKSVIEVELTDLPITYTYERAMLAFCIEVNKRFPPGSFTAKGKRTIQQIGGNQPQGREHYGGRYYGGRGRGRGGRGRGRGRGRGGRGYYNNSNANTRTVTGKDGNTYEVNPAWLLPDHIFQQIPEDTKAWMTQERTAHRLRNGGSNNQRSMAQMSRELAEMKSANDDLRSVVSQFVPGVVSQGDQQSTISQVTTATGIMGGRNQRIQNKNNRM